MNRPGDDGGWTDVELDLLPVYLVEERPGRPWRRPLPEAFRLLAPPAAAFDQGAPRSRLRYQLWVDAAPSPRRPWTEGAVRRLVDLPFTTALDALAELLSDGPETILRDGSAWLALTPGRARATGAECWIPGALHVHRCGRPVRVELVLEPWSSTRTDVRLQVRCARGTTHLPRRYYDVAHDVIDAVRDAMEQGTFGLWSRFGSTTAVAC